MREKSRKEEENYYELKKRFPKHLYESDAEESDYELTDRDLHPNLKWLIKWLEDN